MYFLTVFHRESYVDFDMPKYLRSFLAQVRLRDFTIKNRPGRYCEPVEERIFTLRSKNIVVNEIHFY